MITTLKVEWIRQDGLPNPLDKLGVSLGFFRRFADSFWKATGMEVDLVYADGEPWESVARRVKGPFCRKLALNPSYAGLCSECFLGACQVAQLKNAFHTVSCHAGQNFSVRSLGQIGGAGVLILTGRVVTTDHEEIAEDFTGTGPESPHIKTEESYQSALQLIDLSLPFLRLRLDIDLLLASRELPPLVRKACHYVDEHFRENISVASECGVSTNYLSHSFTKQTGNPLSRYISAVRIGHAMFLLQEAKPAISEIAFEVGFQSLSQFNRTFRALRGMAPGEFCRQERGSGREKADSA